MSDNLQFTQIQSQNWSVLCCAVLCCAALRFDVCDLASNVQVPFPVPPKRSSEYPSSCTALIAAACLLICAPSAVLCDRLRSKNCLFLDASRFQHTKLGSVREMTGPATDTDTTAGGSGAGGSPPTNPELHAGLILDVSGAFSDLREQVDLVESYVKYLHLVELAQAEQQSPFDDTF